MILPARMNGYYGGILKSVLILLMSLAIFNGCTSPEITLQQEKWGEVNGKQVNLYTLTNSHGMVVKLTNYGGIITSIIVPDRAGNPGDVVLGFDNLQQYLDPNPCFGATIGRFANRIKGGEFEINGHCYQLTRNDGDNCTHGGNEFDRVVWDSETVENKSGKGICLHYFSKDGTHGFPGNLEVTVTYTLSQDNAITVHFEATTDQPTHVNMTQHSYFNLSAAKENIYNHMIKIDADRFTEIDSKIVPTGVISSVKGKIWDLTKSTRIGDNIDKMDFNGYHYCYVFNKPEGSLKEVIAVVDPKSGRTLNVSTTQPGVQFYTGNSIPNNIIGKYGIQYGTHSAFCLETQHFPDTPHHSNFPSTLLMPGKKYNETVVYHFGIMNSDV